MDADTSGFGTVALSASSTWHAGFTSTLSLAVWAGDETKEGDGSSHRGTVAEGIWWKLVDALPERYRADNLGAPDGIEEADLGDDGRIEDEARVDDQAAQEAAEEEAAAEERTAEETTADQPQEDEAVPTTEDVTSDPGAEADGGGGGWPFDEE